MPAVTIRPATVVDVESLVDVELAAGQLFREVGMSQIADHLPDRSLLREGIYAGRVWVAEAATGVAGYISAEVLDGNAHVAQVSVAPQYRGRRIGHALVELVERWGRESGRAATTLTTFLDVPWNAPYYRRLGYRVLDGDEIGPELGQTMAHEAAMPGIDASLRCAMIKDNEATSAGADRS